MAYFAWVRNQQAWVPTTLSPQIIHDEKMAEYIISQGHLTIVARHPISDNEAKMSVEILAKRYPAPGTIITK